MNRPPPLAVILAAGPDAPGARAAVDRAAAAAAAGRAVRVLLSGGGLAWADDADLARLPEVAVCSLNARAAGWSAASSPAGLRWSSVGTWLAELDADGRAALWSVLP